MGKGREVELEASYLSPTEQRGILETVARLGGTFVLDPLGLQAVSRDAIPGRSDLPILASE